MNDNGSKNTESEIKFYEFGSEEKRQEKLNEALKSVMDKDFLAFNERLDKINKEIKRFLDEKSIPFGSLGNDVSKIDEIIENNEELINNLIIEKNSIKTGVFAKDKKAKKERIKNLDEATEYLTNCQNTFNEIKKEYKVLSLRNVKENDLDDEEDDSVKKDALERTINFYMNKDE